jgi:hypothetical protein
MSGYLYHLKVPFSFFLCGQAIGPQSAHGRPQIQHFKTVQYPKRHVVLTGLL